VTRSEAVARPGVVAIAATTALATSVAVAAMHPGPAESGLGFALLACALASRLITTELSGPQFISGAFLAGALAAGLLGPLWALIIPVAQELLGWLVERYRRIMLLLNAGFAALPTVLAALVLDELAFERGDSAFYIALAIASFAIIVVNAEIVALGIALVDGLPLGSVVSRTSHLAPVVLINIALVTSAAAVYEEDGPAVLVLVLVAVVAFTYMARLVATARERARQYANLSWGVLSGLIRTLDARDRRAARHCAAVARFSRDIARHVGMSEREQELAHTAGLLHDIGRFALSDRVMDGNVALTEEDWAAIRRHPEIGADLLRDIGIYGPLAEIIIAHHERIDGKGYPRGIKGDAIPEIAKIVAVAEAYDTLTAPDTYRTPLSSFEALTELRRVAGTQLESRYVEALAELLAGQGVEYRHAAAADYDEELAIERRMNEAAGG